MRFLFFLLAVLSVPGLAVVPVRAQDFHEAQPPLPALDLEIGPARFTAEIARTPEQLERGLMFRAKMGDNDGMLFVLGREEKAIFWMENTVLPLSVAYMDSTGRILEIYDMKPYDRTEIKSQSDKIAYALETNQGWFVLNKIGPGTLIRPAQGAFGKPPLSPLSASTP